MLFAFYFLSFGHHRYLHSFPTRRSSDLTPPGWLRVGQALARVLLTATVHGVAATLLTHALEIPHLREPLRDPLTKRSEEHTSELQSRPHLVCRLLLEKKKQERIIIKTNT